MVEQCRLLYRSPPREIQKSNSRGYISKKDAFYTRAKKIGKFISKRYLIIHPKNPNVENYLEVGGYPEYVLERSPNYLNELFRDIVMKDIVSQFKISRSEYFYEIASLLAKQVGFGNSFNKMANVTGITDDTVKTYTEYLTRTYVVNSVMKYSRSLNDRIYSARKFYFYDLGMRNSFAGFEDIGALAENAVYLKLQQKYGGDSVFYLKTTNNQEVDFIVVNKDKAILVEVKYIALKPAIIQRLSQLFFKDIHSLDITERIVITKGLSVKETIKSKEIQFISLEEFLLS